MTTPATSKLVTNFPRLGDVTLIPAEMSSPEPEPAPETLLAALDRLAAELGGPRATFAEGVIAATMESAAGRIRELEAEVARLNHMVEGMGKALDRR